MSKLFPQSTSKREDGGVSGAKAFWSGAWISNSKTETETYLGFKLSCFFTGFRFESSRDIAWKAVKQDWINEVNNILSEYGVENSGESSYRIYRAKYLDKIKEETQEEKKNREAKEYAVEENKKAGKDAAGNDTYKGMLDQIDELKKSSAKALELKTKDMEEIMKKVEAKNQEETDKLNQKIELKNEEITKLAQEAQKAKREGDIATQNRINVLIRKHQEELVTLNNDKKNIPTPNDFSKYLKESGDNSMVFDPKSGRFWLFSSIAVVGLTIIVILISWAIKKIRTIFTS